MSARSDRGKGSLSAKEVPREDDTISLTSDMSRMSFESVRPNIDRNMSLERKIIRYKTRTVSEPIYEDELVKNMTIEIHYKATNTNLNSIYISIKVC